MNGRFLHLVVTNLIRGRRRAYTLHLIDPSTLFYPTPRPSHGPAGDVTALGRFLLPPAAMTFYGPSQLGHLGAMEFMPLGEGSKKRIIAMDHKCRTVLYDLASHSTSTMPALHAPKIRPISVPVGNSLYVMKTNPKHNQEHCFEALIHGRGPESRRRPDWYWHSLPPPPYVEAPSYEIDHGGCNEFGGDSTNESAEDSSDEFDEYNFNEFGKDNCNKVDGHALVGGSHIWVSAGNAGTHSFSTVAGTWSKVGDWEMPFSGRAEYIPEFNLYLGFSAQDNLLCASNLAAASRLQPPKLLGKWADVVRSEEWTPVTSDLVPLGSGKVFIARFFEIRERSYFEDVYRNVEFFAMFTGVELEYAGGQLRMWRHKSMRYNPDCRMLHWVI